MPHLFSKDVLYIILNYLQLAIPLVQKSHAGTQRSHWDRTNKGTSIWNYVCLLLVLPQCDFCIPAWRFCVKSLYKECHLLEVATPGSAEWEPKLEKTRLLLWVSFQPEFAARGCRLNRLQLYFGEGLQDYEEMQTYLASFIFCQGNFMSYLLYYGVFYVLPIIGSFSGSVINLSFTVRHDRSDFFVSRHCARVRQKKKII